VRTTVDSTAFVSQIVGAIREVVGPGPVALHEPSFDGNEWIYLKECLDSNYVSSVGKFVDQFELSLANYTGAKYAISVVNGTAALQIALKLAGVNSGEEVLLPALTFVATANAISYLGAIPHFVDSEESTLGIDAVKLREYLSTNTEEQSGLCINKSTRRVIRALIPMHTFGHPSDLEQLLSIARDFNLVLVEDAAESLGSFYKGQHTGTFGLLSTLSFNGNKTITTGGGGAILTNDEELAKRAKHLTTTAKIFHKWEFDHDEIGYNYRMPNINAALGCAQMEKLPEKISSKRELFKRYKEEFKLISGASIFEELSNCQSNYWLQTLLLEDDNLDLRDSVLEASNKEGIMARPAWKLMSNLAPYRNSPAMSLESANSLYRRVINLPSSPVLSVGIR
jgi:aminotransferase in exopolysaccharide biosynthesis